eukprot:gene7997-9840_t
MALPYKNIIKNEVSSISFQFYSTEELRKLSVKQIIEVEAFDILGGPLPGGLHDPCLGPTGPPERCSTCSLDYIECPGHFGHIELALPVYNPVVFPYLLKILKNMCFNCHQFKHGKDEIRSYIKQFTLLYQGDVVEAKKYKERHQQSLLAEKFVDEENPKKDEEDEEERSGEEEDEFEKMINSMSISFTDQKVTHFEDFKRELFREFFTAATSHTLACANCQAFSPKLRNGNPSRSKLFIMPLGDKQRNANSKLKKAKLNFSSVENESEHGTWFAPWEVRKHITKLFEKEREIMDLLFGHLVPVPGKVRQFKKESNIETFFQSVFPVTPSRYRPPNVVNGRRTEHPQNSHYKGMLKSNRLIKASIESGEGKAHFLVNSVCELQYHVNNMYDNSKAVTPMTPVAAGIKQILEKKEGLFRKHMMGKRVNYAARTVISPDISLESNEMGVPQYFAKTLTFPQPVTSFNYNQLAQAVINGPDVYPGANFIEDENGYLTNLAKESLEKRIALSKTLLTSRPHAPRGINKKVYRHLVDGDYVLANRQPTLHKPGIMGHRVKVLGKNEKTLRMHYCNCSTYNADFDGDEMNIHFPQSLLASSEIREIAANNYQYLGPRNGGPLRGLIQDHISTGVLLTKRDTLFTRDEFIQILYASCWAINTNHPIQVPPPCILKPRPLWSGKQLIGAALNHLTIGRKPMNLEAASKIPAKMWGTYGLDITRDATVIIRENEMMAGILDKGHFGASSYGLVHACYELYDPHVAGSLLTLLGRMFTNYLSNRGFTCGVDDLLMKQKEEEFRAAQLKSANQEGYNVAAKFADIKTYKEKESREFMAKALQSEREVARLDGMLKKALNTYTSKIIDTLIPGGQVKGFPKNNFSLMTVSGAKGSVVNFSQVSCLLGQQELEGKRVPRMVSGKTLPSFQAYDPSARAGGFVMDRFLTGVRPQDYFFHCMAGREGLIDTAVKTSRSGYLQRCLIKHLEGLSVHYDNTVRDSDGSVIQFNYGEDSLEIGKTPYLEKFSVIADNYQLVKNQFSFDELIGYLKNSSIQEYIGEVKENSELDPVMSKFNPSSDLGCVSESFQSKLDSYIQKNPDGLIQTGQNKKGKIPEKDFRNLMYLYFNRAMISPGESVGLVCAQSIGEPSTQMTLNTFHLAGRGEANVTLGIPRLRELIMTASTTPSTPLMEFQLNDPTNKKETEKLAKYLEILKMSDIIKGVNVEEYNMEINRHYDVEISFISNLSEILSLKKVKEQEMPTICEKFVKVINSQVRRINKLKSMEIGKGNKSKSDNDTEGRMNVDDDDDNEGGQNGTVVGDDSINSSSSKNKKKSKGPTIDDDIPTDSKKVLMVGIVETEALKYVIKSCKGITRCFVNEKNVGGRTEYSIQTEGVNLREICQLYHKLKIDQIYTNDIANILKKYGVEACRRAITSEISNVFGAYGISVDRRHLSLLADYMTFEGGYKALNRIGIENNTSPFQKMSFETTFNFLSKSSLMGDQDSVISPSSRIVLGQIVKSGTGSFDIVVPVN